MNPSIPYTLIRTRRKTFAIIVDGDGSVTVRAPLHAAKSQVESILEQKSGWLQKQLEPARRQAAARPAHAFAAGESFPFLGVDYPLTLVKRASPLLHLDGSFELARSVQSQARQVFEGWYKAQARRLFNQRVAYYSGIHGLTVRRVRLSSALTRWGSCSSLGDINLVWRLIMAPPEIIDYVVVHELAHRVERNHSTLYWLQVEKMMPDYRTRRAWLKKHGASLAWE